MPKKPGYAKRHPKLRKSAVNCRICIVAFENTSPCHAKQKMGMLPKNRQFRCNTRSENVCASGLLRMGHCHTHKRLRFKRSSPSAVCWRNKIQCLYIYHSKLTGRTWTAFFASLNHINHICSITVSLSAWEVHRTLCRLFNNEELTFNDDLDNAGVSKEIMSVLTERYGVIWRQQFTNPSGDQLHKLFTSTPSQ